MRTTNNIEAGWDAYGSDGQKIGSIYDVSDEYIVVEKGLFFPKDIYVPTSAIERTDASDGRVYLNVAKDDVESRGWSEPQATEGSERYTDRESTRDVSDAESVRVPVHEESLRAEKRTEQAGEVGVRKRVREREETLDVPVTRDEVQVRRVAVDRTASANTAAFDDGDTIRVPVMEERVEVKKEPRVVEEIEISKRPVTEKQRVSETVRREEIEVQGADTERRGSTAGASDRDREMSGAMATKRTGYGDDDGDVHGTGVAGAGAGAVGGAVAGGAVGGPVGAVAGAAIGAAGGGMAGEAAEDEIEDKD